MSGSDRRVLIVNGDDFGLTPGVNIGIIAAHQRGILTSASLFANAPATDAAIALTRSTHTLGVGCHLTLVDGRPTLPLSQIPSLAPEGAFRGTWRAFIAAVVARRVDLTEIERELTAQIDRIRSAGVILTHLDSHKHVHAYPPIFDIVARLARRFEIPIIRVPWEPRPIRVIAAHAWIPKARRQALENLALTPWARRDHALLASYGMRAAPAFAGRALTGVFTSSRLRTLLTDLAPGVHELMTHPGYPDGALDQVRTRLREQRAVEVALLTEPAVLDAVRRARIVLARHDGVAHTAKCYSNAS